MPSDEDHISGRGHTSARTARQLSPHGPAARIDDLHIDPAKLGRETLMGGAVVRNAGRLAHLSRSCIFRYWEEDRNTRRLRFSRLVHVLLLFRYGQSESL